jgi:GNAT superfamily N-acetyltransferase
MTLTIAQQSPTKTEIFEIMKLIKQTQNITGYTFEQYKQFTLSHLAYVNGDFAGACFCIDITKNISEIAVLIVREEYRGLGIGKKLFLKSVTDLKEKDKTIWCVSRNPIVLLFFSASDLQFTSFWKLPPPVLWHNLNFVCSIYRIKEFFRKKMYDSRLPSFQYAIRYSK